MKKNCLKLLLALLIGVMLVFFSGSNAFAEEEKEVWSSEFDGDFAYYIWEAYGIERNFLTEAEIAQITELDIQDASLNSLRGIQHLTALQKLNVSGNELTEMDLSKNTKLTSLKCANNFLTSLDLSKNTKLKTLDCSNNFLEQLDLSANTALTKVNADYNFMGCLDLAANTAITEASCKSNEYMMNMKKDSDGNYTFDLSKCEGFVASKASNFSEGSLSGTVLTVAPGTEKVTYTYKMRSGVSQKFTLHVFVPIKINATNFPDEGFRKYVTTKFDTNPANGTLSYAEVAAIKEIEYSGTAYINRISVTGCEHFFNLEKIDVSLLGQDPLDFRKNKKLVSIIVWNSQTTKINTKGLYNLRSLDCTSNNFKNFDLSDNFMLEKFRAYGNHCSALDFSNNPRLKYIIYTDYSTNNHTLVSLDISANKRVERLRIEGCGLTSLDVSHMTELYFLTIEEGYLTEIDVSKNKKLRSLEVYGNKLKKLNIKNNPELYILDFSGNQISTIDYSNNPELMYLFCSNNKLTTLDLSSLPKLHELDCSDNPLEELNLSKASGLYGLDCSNIGLKKLDVSKCTGLNKLDCSDNQLEKLDISNNTKLETLHVYNNSLSSLDLSKAKELEGFRGENNHFTYLDFSACEDSLDYVVIGAQTAVVKMKRNAAGEFVYDLKNLPGGFKQSAVKQWSLGEASRSGSVVTIPKGSDSLKYTFSAGGKTSDWVTLTFVAPELMVVNQPTDASVNEGEKASFTVKGQGSVLSYQWQYYDTTKKAWANSSVSSAKKATLTFTANNYLTLNGRKYRCVITDSDGQSVTSKAAVLTVIPTPLEITKQPASFTGKIGEKVTFSVEASGKKLTYQWQYKNADASAWTNSNIAAAKTATMTFTIGTDSKLNGRKYRCVITDSDGQSVNSKSATLTVDYPALTVDTQPVDAAGKVGESVTFHVAATGDGVTYQWQYRNVGVETWSNSNIAAAKTATMKFTIGTDSKLNGRQYRCVLKDKYGQSVTTKEVTLTVKPDGPVITQQPSDSSVKVGDKVTFRVEAEGDGLTYQWQYRNAGVETWSNSNIVAAKTATMTFTATSKSLSGRQYKCVVKDEKGKTVESKAVTLTVE